MVLAYVLTFSIKAALLVIPVANNSLASRDQKQKGKKIREGKNPFFGNQEQVRVEMRKMGRRIRTRLHAFSETRDGIRIS